MPEITKPDASQPSPIPAFVWMAFVVLVLFAYLFGLTIPLIGPDEPRYAQVAREMLESGDWVTPTLGGVNWFEKPALLYWLQIASYKIFGISEFAARFGSAIFGLGTVASLWIMVRSSSRAGTEDDAPASGDFANWLALIAASTLGIVVFARGASFDIIITFPVTAAIASFYIFHQSTNATFKSRYLPLLLFYVFSGLALLAKGLIGIVFPIAIVLFFYVLSRCLPSRTFIYSLVWGTLVSVLIASLWYWPMYDRHGFQFIDEFFIQHHFQRFTSNKYQHPQPFYFFLWVLPLMTLPWMPFFLRAIWKLLTGLFYRRAETAGPESYTDEIAAHSPLVILAASWLAVPLVFFSLSGSKLPGYILPAVPAAIILTSLLVYGLVRRSARWRTTVLSVATATLFGVIALLIFAVPRYAEADSVKSLLAAAEENGFGRARVIMLHTISHNAEFYAAGRLSRGVDRKQQQLYGVDEIIGAMAAKGDRSALVLVPLEYVGQLTGAPQINAAFLKDNGELAIVAVTLK